MSFKNHNGVHFHSFLWLIVPDKTSLWVQRMPLRSLSNLSSLTFSLNPLGFESLTLGKKTVSIHLIYTSHDLAHPFGLLHSKEKKSQPLQLLPVTCTTFCWQIMCTSRTSFVKGSRNPLVVNVMTPLQWYQVDWGKCFFRLWFFSCTSQTHGTTESSISSDE